MSNDIDNAEKIAELVRSYGPITAALRELVYGSVEPMSMHKARQAAVKALSDHDELITPTIG